MFRTKIVHNSGKVFDFFGVETFRFLGSKNIFNPCSHIELNTQNPNPRFKIAICFTKTPKHQNACELLVFFLKSKNSHFLFCIMYKLYNSYFVFFRKFVNFVILGFVYFCICIFIYITRVGLLHV